MHRQIPIPEPLLRDLLAHAASAARIVGHLDDTHAVGPLADHVDSVVHGLTELLGVPHPIADVDDEPTVVRPCPALPPRRRLVEGAQ